MHPAPQLPQVLATVSNRYPVMHPVHTLVVLQAVHVTEHVIQVLLDRYCPVAQAEHWSDGLVPVLIAHAVQLLMVLAHVVHVYILVMILYWCSS